ncbi:hypothetical protein [Nocardioides sp.]|uniref:hypothetical protein n=1 Tax=Nocardioides sp. TaxID=35761 RepID=UPI0035621DA8
MPVGQVRTVTERFEGDRDDKTIVADLCHRLGFDPQVVSALTFRVEGGALVVEVTRRSDITVDPARRLLRPVPTL